MNSDAYHLTIKTQNTADGENTTNGEKGKKVEAWDAGENIRLLSDMFRAISTHKQKSDG